MTPEYLLKPRYKVIADYPRNPFSIGDILMQDFDTIGHVWIREDQIADKTSDRSWADDLEKYPALFKKLEWWEERKPEDLPEYVKENKDGGYFAKVKKHFSDSKGEPNKYGCQLELYTDWNFFSYSNWLPTTESEYNEYINSKPANQ